MYFFSGESRLPKLGATKSKLPTAGASSGLPVPCSGLPLPSTASAASRPKVTTAVQAGNGHLRASRERDSASRRLPSKQIPAPGSGPNYIAPGSRTSPSPSPSPGPELRTRDLSTDPQTPNGVASSSNMSRVDSSPSVIVVDADTAQTSHQSAKQSAAAATGAAAAAASRTTQQQQQSLQQTQTSLANVLTNCTQSATVSPPTSQQQQLLSSAAQILAGSLAAQPTPTTAASATVTSPTAGNESSSSSNAQTAASADGTPAASEASSARTSVGDESLLKTGAEGVDPMASLSLLDGYHLLASNLGLDLSNEEVDEELLESLTALPIALPACLISPFAHLKQLSSNPTAAQSPSQSQASLCSPGNSGQSPAAAAQMAALSMPPSLRLNLTRLLDRTRLNTIDESDSPPPLLSAAARAAAAAENAAHSAAGVGESPGADQQVSPAWSAANGEAKGARTRRQGSLRLEKTSSYTTDYDSASAISDADTAISSNDVSGNFNSSIYTRFTALFTAFLTV